MSHCKSQATHDKPHGTRLIDSKRPLRTKGVWSMRNTCPALRLIPSRTLRLKRIGDAVRPTSYVDALGRWGSVVRLHRALATGESNNAKHEPYQSKFHGLAASKLF